MKKYESTILQFTKKKLTNLLASSEVSAMIKMCLETNLVEKLENHVDRDYLLQALEILRSKIE